MAGTTPVCLAWPGDAWGASWPLPEGSARPGHDALQNAQRMISTGLDMGAAAADISPRRAPPETPRSAMHTPTRAAAGGGSGGWGRLAACGAIGAQKEGAVAFARHGPCHSPALFRRVLLVWFDRSVP